MPDPDRQPDTLAEIVVALLSTALLFGVPKWRLAIAPGLPGGTR